MEFARRVLVVFGASCFFACEPTLVVGDWTCPPGPSEASGASPVVVAAIPVQVPWETGFEHRFCDWTQVGGSCYQTGPASRQLVSSPARSGDFAAAFTVTGAAGKVGQTRCHRRGVYPDEAYYGAWYYIPATARNTDNWNLFHFGGQNPPYTPDVLRGLWDVSLVNGANGRLNARLINYVHDASANGPAVPIGAWFHLVVYFKRAKDSTGELALYQDGVQVARLTDQSTDDTESGDWYVGNYANSLTPAESVLYVDDVTIRDTP